MIDHALRFLSAPVRRMTLAPVISNPRRPGAAFGTTGTYASVKELRRIEEDRETAGPDHTIILNHIYDSYRSGAPFPVKDEEILALMDVITRAKQQAIVRADTIR